MEEKILGYYLSKESMQEYLPYAHPMSWYTPGRVIHVHDLMSKGYKYRLSCKPGREFDEGFNPELTPAEMLSLGVFEGKYLNDCMNEFPREWYREALRRGKLSPEYPDEGVNAFEIKSRQSLKIWRKKKWSPLNKDDPDTRGWFQWYCRYYLGRRLEGIDEIQIGRWRAFVRHRAQVIKSMKGKKMTKAEKRDHRPRQRQALAQWAYYPFV